MAGRNDDRPVGDAFDPAIFLLEIQGMSVEERRRFLQEYHAACREQAEAIFEALK